MSQFKLSMLHGFQSLSLSLKKVAALQFFRHPPVRSVNLGIFSQLPFSNVGLGGFHGRNERVYSILIWDFDIVWHLKFDI
jgi:hypothetical protein